MRNFSKSLRNASSLIIRILALSLVFPVVAAANEDTVAIVGFLDIVGTARLAMERQLSKTQGEPELEAIAAKAMAAFDPSEFAKREGAVFEKFLDQDDILSFKAFIASPTGAKVARIFKEQKNPDGLVQALNDLPPEDKSKTNAFFGSRAMGNANTAANSAEARQAGRIYGEDLMCRYARDNDIAALKKLNSASKCL